jgi:hypothetical protein
MVETWTLDLAIHVPSLVLPARTTFFAPASAAHEGAPVAMRASVARMAAAAIRPLRSSPISHIPVSRMARLYPLRGRSERSRSPGIETARDPVARRHASD